MPLIVEDYLLVTIDGQVSQASENAPPAGAHGPVDLSEAVRLETLDGRFADRLLLAAEFRGERWEPAHQFGVAQAFVRTVDATDPGHRHLYARDEDDTLLITLGLSRLVRPHTIACDYAVRHIVEENGTERMIPHDAAEARVAYRIDDGSRGWLDVVEAQQLGALLSAYQPDQLPDRVARALWFCELMVRERYLEDTLPLLVAGLEALLKVGRRQLTEQFAQRSAALAGELSIALAEADARDAYDDRSGIVHGARIDLTQPRERNRFTRNAALLQQTLRGAVRRAVEDPAFRMLFASDATIRDRWPLQGLR